MTNYVSRFIPNYATITHPLRILTRKETKWEWSAEQQAAVEELKRHLVNEPIVSYFDPDGEVEIFTDASPVGLGAVLTQVERLHDGEIKRTTVSYASRALTSVESRYSQTEREALGVVWACERFHLYVYGTDFTVITDHQSLLPMFNNPRAKLPGRVERW